MAKKKEMSEFEALTKEGWSVMPSFLEEKTAEAAVAQPAPMPSADITAPMPAPSYMPAAPAATSRETAAMVMPSQLTELARAKSTPIAPIAPIASIAPMAGTTPQGMPQGAPTSPAEQQGANFINSIKQKYGSIRQ